MLKIIRAFAWTEFKVYLRNRSALFWTLINPLVTLVLLMSIFGNGEPAARLDIDLHVAPEIQGSEIARSIVGRLSGTEFLRVRVVSGTPEDRNTLGARLGITGQAGEGRVRLDHLYGTPGQFRVLQSAAAEAVGEYNLRTSAARPRVAFEARAQVDGSGPPYGEYLTIGILMMTVVSVCLFGFSIPLVELRSSGAGRMYQVFPMSISEFMAAYILSRIAVVVLLGLTIVTFADLVYRLSFPLGDARFWLDLVVLCLVGAMAFMSVGLMLAGMVGSVAGVSAIVNLIFLPLMLFSDIFIPLSLFPDGLEEILRMAPLAQFVNASRAVLIDGSPIYAQWPAIASLFALAIVCLIVARFTFRWADL